jgi:ATP/maltotriose-dependent transcriptional regulator MalT
MASRTVSLAKLSKPRLFGVMPRERLFELIDCKRDHPLILVAAPPGAGKTVLIASYIAARALPAVWYQADRGDAAPLAFFSYLTQAARRLAPRKRPLPEASLEAIANLSAFGRCYFREFFARLPTGALVVFDNFQEIPEDSEVQRVMGEAFEEIPEGRTVVLISRVDLPAQYSRFAADKRMTRIDWEQLQFTFAETRALAGVQGIGNGLDIRGLHDQARGWAAGVTLMLERHRSHQTGNVAHGNSLQEVFKYLAGEVFDRTPLEHQRLMLALSFLPRVSAAAAVELSRNPAADKILDGLVRQRLFIDKHDGPATPSPTPEAESLSPGNSHGTDPVRANGPTPAFEFHPLFRAYLQHHARETCSAEEVAEMAGRAAALLRRNSQSEEAFDLYCEALDLNAATQLLLQMASRLIAELSDAGPQLMFNEPLPQIGER